MKCQRCHTEYSTGDLEGANVTHDAEECLDTLVKQRDELDQKLDSLGYEHFANETELEKAKEALRWYAASEIRDIEGDVGLADVARAALAAMADNTRDSDANRYHQSLGAKWMNEMIVFELRRRAKHENDHVYERLAKLFEHLWENEAFWRGGARAKEKKDGG